MFDPVATTIRGINGILSKGRDNTDLMLGDLESLGYVTRDDVYPLRHIWQTRSRRQQYSDARLLLGHHYQPGDAVVAHSYGCLVCLRMMELGAQFSDVFWFRPAMNRDYVIPMNGCERLTVIHSPGDRAIRMGAMLPWHDFGNAGRFGLLAGDPKSTDRWDHRVTNIEAPKYERSEFWRHGDDFLDANRSQWVDFIEKKLRGGEA